MNVQHNCARNKCGLTGHRVIVQERHETDQYEPIIQHKNPEDVVINTGQMRDAHWVQQFTEICSEVDLMACARSAVHKVYHG